MQYSNKIRLFGQVYQLQSVLFELEIKRQSTPPPTQPQVEGLQKTEYSLAVANAERRASHGSHTILLKGQMRFLAEIDAIIYLCSPL